MFVSENDKFDIPAVLTVGSGKGGVGKSIISLGMAYCLAERGLRILLIDADAGLGNLHILANAIPAFTLEDILAGNCSVEDARLKISPNLDLLPADSGMYYEDNVNLLDVSVLRSRLAGLKKSYDLLVVDTASGISAKSINLAMMADNTFLVVTPELGALADGYAVLKLLHQKKRDSRAVLFVNMSHCQEEGKSTADKFGEMVDRFLGLKMKHCLWLPYDPQIRSILLRQNLLCQKGGKCALLNALDSLLNRIFTDFPAIQSQLRRDKDNNAEAGFTLSSQSSPTDNRIEILYAGQPENKSENPKSHVSRNDSL